MGGWLNAEPSEIIFFYTFKTHPLVLGAPSLPIASSLFFSHRRNVNTTIIIRHIYVVDLWFVSGHVDSNKHSINFSRRQLLSQIRNLSSVCNKFGGGWPSEAILGSVGRFISNFARRVNERDFVASWISRLRHLSFEIIWWSISCTRLHVVCSGFVVNARRRMKMFQWNLIFTRVAQATYRIDVTTVRRTLEELDSCRTQQRTSSSYRWGVWVCALTFE